jgi:hypothetical protein
MATLTRSPGRNAVKRSAEYGEVVPFSAISDVSLFTEGPPIEIA